MLVSSFFILYVNKDVESTLESSCLKVSAYISSSNVLSLYQNIFCKQNNLTLGTDTITHQKPWPMIYGCELDRRLSRTDTPQQLQNEEICIILLGMSDVGFFFFNVMALREDKATQIAWLTPLKSLIFFCSLHADVINST